MGFVAQVGKVGKDILEAAWEGLCRGINSIDRNIGLWRLLDLRVGVAVTGALGFLAAVFAYRSIKSLSKKVDCFQKIAELCSEQSLKISELLTELQKVESEAAQNVKSLSQKVTDLHSRVIACEVSPGKFQELVDEGITKQVTNVEAGMIGLHTDFKKLQHSVSALNDHITELDGHISKYDAFIQRGQKRILRLSKQVDILERNGRETGYIIYWVVNYWSRMVALERLVFHMPQNLMLQHNTPPAIMPSSSSSSSQESELLASDEVSSIFANVGCVRRTAVQIGGQFIHANRITLIGFDDTFIASQYPYPDSENQERFWRAVFASGSGSGSGDFPMIIDLSTPDDIRRLKESLPSLVEGYYPKDKQTPFQRGGVLVTLKGSQSMECYTKEDSQPMGRYTKYVYSVQIESVTKTVVRIHNPNWIDYKDLQGNDQKKIQAWVNYLSIFLPFIESLKIPKETVVHCMAGVSRTGTLIIALALHKKIFSGEINKKNFNEEFSKILKEARGQRNNMFGSEVVLREYATKMFEAVPVPSPIVEQSEVVVVPSAAMHDLESHVSYISGRSVYPDKPEINRQEICGLNRTAASALLNVNECVLGDCIIRQGRDGQLIDGCLGICFSYIGIENEKTEVKNYIIFYDIKLHKFYLSSKETSPDRSKRIKALGTYRHNQQVLENLSEGDKKEVLNEIYLELSKDLGRRDMFRYLLLDRILRGKSPE